MKKTITKTKIHTVFFLTIILMLTINSCNTINLSPTTGDVKGNIFVPACNVPLPSGTVILSLPEVYKKYTTAVDENGDFHFKDIEPNTYWIEVYWDEKGYGQTAGSILVEAGETTIKNITDYGGTGDDIPMLVGCPGQEPILPIP